MRNCFCDIWSLVTSTSRSNLAQQSDVGVRRVRCVVGVNTYSCLPTEIGVSSVDANEKASLVWKNPARCASNTRRSSFARNFRRGDFRLMEDFGLDPIQINSAPSAPIHRIVDVAALRRSAWGPGCKIVCVAIRDKERHASRCRYRDGSAHLRGPRTVLRRFARSEFRRSGK